MIKEQDERGEKELAAKKAKEAGREEGKEAVKHEIGYSPERL